MARLLRDDIVDRYLIVSNGWYGFQFSGLPTRSGWRRLNRSQFSLASSQPSTLPKMIGRNAPNTAAGYAPNGASKYHIEANPLAIKSHTIAKITLPQSLCPRGRGRIGCMSIPMYPSSNSSALHARQSNRLRQRFIIRPPTSRFINPQRAGGGESAKSRAFCMSSYTQTNLLSRANSFALQTVPM